MERSTATYILVREDASTGSTHKLPAEVEFPKRSIVSNRFEDVMTLELGKKAPDFSLHIGNDKIIKLSDLKEKFVVLYFYPKDDTPGCTIEAQDFNRIKPEFDKLNTVIIGVSKDKLDSHDKFKEKYSLGFDLASDANSNLCEQLGVWIEKSMFGKKYMGIDRTTFLLDKERIVKHIWRSVNAKNHAQEVLEKLRTMLS